MNDTAGSPEGELPPAGATGGGSRGIRTPIMLWGALTSVLLVLQHVSNRVTRESGYRLGQWQGLHNYLDGWSQFDGPEYLGIVEHGYWYTPGVRSPVVWFPLYPLLTRLVRTVVTDPLIAGIVVSGLAGVAAVTIYWKWLDHKDVAPHRRVVPLAVLMLYPYGWYLYGVVHSDSLFLLLVVAACLLVERERFVAAGVVGALATATRPTGLALIVGLVVLGLEHGGVLRVPLNASGIVRRFRIPIAVDLGRLRSRPVVLAPALCVLGVAAYMTYLGARFGDPLAFVNNQRVYHEAPLPVLKLLYFEALTDWSDARVPLTLTGQACLAAIVFCSVPFVGRRFGWGYATFTAALVGLPTAFTADFMGTGRYLIAAFPTAALLGEWLADRRRGVRITWLVASGALMVGMSMGFARSWYLT